MRIQVAGRQMDVGEALRTRITEELEARVSKYFSRATDAVVTVAKNGVGFDVDCTLHLASGISLQAHGHGGDAHAAFSDSLDKIEKRVRRYKRRLKNHHSAPRTPVQEEGALAYVLAPLAPEAEEDREDATAEGGADAAPLVIAETKIPMRTMTVSMAVLQLELADTPALLFRNAAHGGLNLIYRRADGNFGWVDPER